MYGGTHFFRKNNVPTYLISNKTITLGVKKALNPLSAIIPLDKKIKK